MAYIGVSPIDVQTTIISGAQNTATLPLAKPTFQTVFISGAKLAYSSDRFFQGLPDPGGLETQADYNVWVFEAFNSQHSIVDTTQPSTPVEGELYYDQDQQELKVYVSGNFIDAQTGPFADVNSRLDALTTSVTGEYLPFTGGKICTTPEIAGPKTDGILQLIRGNDGQGGKLEIRTNDGSGNLTTTTKLYHGGGIDMAGILSLNADSSSATIRAYGSTASGAVKQLNLATGDNSDTTGVATRMRLASNGVTVFSTDLILDTTGAGTSSLKAKGSSGQDVWSLSSDGQFNTPNTIPLKFNTGNSTSQIVAYNGSNAGLDFAVNTSSAGAGNATSLLTLDRTGAIFNPGFSNNFSSLTLNDMSVDWFHGAGSHYLFLDTTANASSQNLSIYSKNIQGTTGSTILVELSHSQSSKEFLVYTNSMTFESEFNNLFFSSGSLPQFITFSPSSSLTLGTGSPSNNTPYLKLENTEVSVGNATHRVDTNTFGFVTLNTPIAANVSGNWFKLKGTAGGIENSDVLRVKQNAGSDSNIEYFGSTSGGNSIQTKTSLVSNIQTSKLAFYETINYLATTPITFFPNTTVGQQYILIGGNTNQTLTFKHMGASQSAAGSGNNMFSINSEGVQVSTGNLSFNGPGSTAQFIKFGTNNGKSFYIAKEDSSGNKYPSFAVNPTNANSGNLVVMPQRTIFGLTENASLDTYANTLTTQPQVTIKGLGTNQNLITFEPNSTSLARTQYIMFGGSGDSSSFGTYQIARGTRTSSPPSVSTDVFIRFRCPSSGAIQTDFLAPVNMPSSVAADNPHTRGEFDTVMTALKAAVNSSTDHASLKAALLSALAAY
jgi:hypothetical protein